MFRTRSIITTIGAIALALAVPATAGAQQDLRSPDAKEAAAAAEGGQRLRSSEATAASAATEAGQDLRSPDARDAARPKGLTQAPDPLAPVDRAPDGFRWGDAVSGPRAHWASGWRSAGWPS